MDFDPSQFLSMAMSEDQNAVYTAPDLPEPSTNIQHANQMITVEGGLQMEEGLNIPVPVFDTFNIPNAAGAAEVEVHNEMETENGEDPLLGDVYEPSILIDTIESHNSIAQQSSPAERTSSPHVKRVIATTSDETRFRKDFFCGNYERVKLFRLHCTICDKHLGCAPWFTERQMRNHKLLNVAVCRKCFDFYGDINFPVEDSSEIYCCWCGEGGEVFCCSKCPKITCKKCVQRNFGETKVKEINENDNWVCFVCNPTEIWPHRTLFWGLQRFAREMRQNCLTLPKEEKMAMLSKDTSHCCPKINEQLPSINLPNKGFMSKIPFCLIAHVHQGAVRNQSNQRTAQNNFIGATSRAMIGVTSQSTNYRFPGTSPRMPSTKDILQNRLTQNNMPYQSPSQPVYSVNQHLQSRSVMNYNRCNDLQVRPRPYPVPRPVSSLVPFNRPPVNNRPGFYKLVGVANAFVPDGRNYSGPTQIETMNVVDNTSLKKILTSTQTLHDTKWLEKGIRDVREAISPVSLMADQFSSLSNELQQDFSKLTSFADRLTYNIKITICNLAKINQDIIDASKQAIDSKVSTVVNDIQMNCFSNSITLTKQTPTVSNEVSLSNPSTKSKAAAIEPAISAPAEDDIGDLNPALLCETVLVEGNKENENKNKPTPVRRPGPKLVGKHNKFKRNQETNIKNVTPSTFLEIVELSDDEEQPSFNESYYLNKYKIRPCQVTLNRCATSVKQNIRK